MILCIALTVLAALCVLVAIAVSSDVWSNLEKSDRDGIILAAILIAVSVTLLFSAERIYSQLLTISEWMTSHGTAPASPALSTPQPDPSASQPDTTIPPFLRAPTSQSSS